MTTTIHPRFATRRGAVRATSWWGRAWVRAVEESAYAEGDLRQARSLARSGRLGSLYIAPGEYAAGLADDDAVSTRTGVPLLDERDQDELVSVIAAEAGRVAALLAGELPHALVEELEEAGVELLPFGGELTSECSCDAWLDPCPHALAVGYQVGWLMDADPWILIALRGPTRDELLARLHRRHEQVDGASADPTDEDVALDAAQRAGRILGLLEPGAADGASDAERSRSIDHLL